MNSSQFWIALKLLRSPGVKLFTPAGWLAMIGLTLGVACLVVSMAVMSGYETTLRNNVADVTGHVQIIRMISAMDEDIEEKIKSETQVKSYSKFLFTEAVLAHKGHISGVYLQGIESDKLKLVLGLESRLIDGSLELKGTEKVGALIGKGIAKNYGLKKGDRFKVVVPQYTDDPSNFRRQLAELEVAGVLDLGKQEYDDRMIITELGFVQEVSAVGEKNSGYILKLDDIGSAQIFSDHMHDVLGPKFRIRDWHDVNANIFEAVKLEKGIIFFVIFIIVIAAAFNVSISLYVNVVKRYSTIGMLKAMGMKVSHLQKIFAIQGLIMGLLGSLFGIFLGFLFCIGFTWLETKFGLLPNSVYRIDRIDVQIRFLDLFVILVASVLMSVLASFSPARRGAKLTTIEGLRYE